jgi:hypothetical protein
MRPSAKPWDLVPIAPAADVGKGFWVVGVGIGVFGMLGLVAFAPTIVVAPLILSSPEIV